MTAGGEVFALTDEQIVGLEAAPESTEKEGLTAETPRSAEGGRDGAAIDRLTDDERGVAARGERTASEGGPYKDGAKGEVPEWLAARMKDPWHGDEAKALWDGKQRAETEVAAYREVFATPEDARTLREIYPGGVPEAKSAAERARALDEIDAAFYRGDAAARTGLAQRMMAQDPEAFRAMVEAGVRLLDGAAGEEKRLTAETQRTAEDREDSKAQTGVSVPQEVVRAYGEMERAANAELEKSVGAAIGRAMEQALPNLKRGSTPGQAGAQHAAPLQERLTGAVREEVEAALKSDRELGEQVARVLAGRRFDAVARGQVVRLIDERAQQLVPGAVKKVVGAWTQTTLAARGENEGPARVEVKPVADNHARWIPYEAAHPAAKNPRQRATEELEAVAVRRGPRVNYSRVTDEEILGL